MRDSALPLPSSNRDKDPILNPRESSSELSDPFVGSPTDPFAEAPPNSIHRSRHNRSFKNPTLFCAEGRAKTPVVTPKAIAPQRTPIINLVDYSDFKGTTLLEKGAGDKLGIAGAIIAYTGRALARLKEHDFHELRGLRSET
ncbi:hypothetical protein L249_1697 [Ophiocordyceps polyrhachis-furcata BCC 54312]|uniref:Uncharacterized protein n=1 Tax=Ophiocordyceps polyrhachis-furcata BCC 54312 TaxID=1330021 RepID=A0A367LSL1_9HYPO|nr:hypothetical protein L249_1697 [Ophiocordyceps polyrhachis-furcata BCC 54312]